jgi:hypothetical protein
MTSPLPPLAYVPHHISEYHYKRRPDATRTSFTMTDVRCLYTSCVHTCNLSHHSTLLWHLLDALTAPQYVLWCAHYICRSIHWFWSRCHEECDRHTNCSSTTLPSSSPDIIRSGDFQSPTCCHTCVPPVYNCFWASTLWIQTTSYWEHLCLSLSAALN